MTDLREKYRLKLPEPEPKVDPELVKEVERAFVLEGDQRTAIVAPLWDIGSYNPAFMYLNGRFVEADNPNRNRTMWSTADLEMSQSTVAGGPLNWLHQEQNIIGCITAASLVYADPNDGDASIGNYIGARAAMWKFLFPEQAATISSAADNGQAFFSMECISEQVTCLECGESFPYAQYVQRQACSELNERRALRRMVNPLFLGGAIIVPPVEPGWSNATVEVDRDAAAAVERASLADYHGFTKGQAEQLAGRILQWVNR